MMVMYLGVQQSLACGGKRKQALSNTVILDDGSDINSQVHRVERTNLVGDIQVQGGVNLLLIDTKFACGCSKGNRTDIPAIVDELGADFNIYLKKKPF
ncbi:hypothetical protein Tco_1433228 [Tanacetum coccineum]